jgi:hypothetical protein
MLQANSGLRLSYSITRNEAAKVAADFLNGTVIHTGDNYDTKKMNDPMDGFGKFYERPAASPQKKQGRRR